MKTRLIICYLFLLINSCAQIGTDRYIIDNSIKAKLDKKIVSRDGITRGSVEFKIYQNDSLITDTGENGLINATVSYINNDTIVVTGYLGMYGAYGFHVFLFKDKSCDMAIFAKTKTAIFKLFESDSLTNDLYIPCTERNLKLVSNPRFKKGEILDGIVELTSSDFFKFEEGNKVKIKIQLAGYFRTDPLE